MPVAKKLTTAYARQLARNYKNRKRHHDDNQGIWFSKEQIEAALKLADGCDATGIRFYFGAYEEDGELTNPTVSEEKFGKTTLILVGTTDKVITEINGQKVYQDELTTPSERPAYVKREIKTAEIAPEYNDGQFCPPPFGDDINDLLHGV